MQLFATPFDWWSLALTIRTILCVNPQPTHQAYIVVHILILAILAMQVMNESRSIEPSSRQPCTPFTNLSFFFYEIVIIKHLTYRFESWIHNHPFKIKSVVIPSTTYPNVGHTKETSGAQRLTPKRLRVRMNASAPT